MFIKKYSLRFIKKSTWEEVFDNWKKREANNPDWVYCATKIKGWPSWESWRSHSANQFGANERKWELHEFTDPLNEIPAMLIGPYSSWQSRLPKKNVHSFDELVAISKQFEKLSKHNKINSILKALPFQASLIGLIREDNNKIVCLEGHHTATAFALGKRKNKKIDFSNTKITINLTSLPKDEIYLLDEALKKGSSKI